jgi:hypothetical protein
MISKKRPHAEDSTDSGEVSVKKLKAYRSDPTIPTTIGSCVLNAGSQNQPLGLIICRYARTVEPDRIELDHSG